MAVAGRVTGQATRQAAGPEAGSGPRDPPRRAASARRWTATLATFLGFSRPESIHQDKPGPRAPAIELDCLRGVLAPSLLASAERRSAEIGVGADQVLIRWGLIDEETYLAHLSAYTGLALEDFATIDSRDFALPATALHFVARHGYLPIRKDGELVYIVAPHGDTARRIAALAATFSSPEMRRRIRLASSARLNDFLSYRCGDALAAVAADGLAAQYPELSAAPPRPAPQHPLRAAARYLLRLAIPVTLLTLAPEATVDACGVLLSIWFLLFVGLRLAGSFVPRTPPARLPPLPDSQLPVYTVVAALYREASSVGPLMQFIDELDYPREKLDIKLVIEADDLRTRAAIARLGLLPHVQVIIAPGAGPRTKPKALNCALSFARGTFITVFDAEDRPEPGQLRAALDAFRGRDGGDIACAQASLCIDNTADGWLPRMFTAEYAGQFDVFLPGFSELRLPLPLGGSSNHFRTAILREAGGWDPYNVTEDADLGFRLARFGYRCVMFPSTTHEEAPARFGAWLRQRSRWMKGWMQTWAVHMRAPRRLWREAGAGGFFTLNILVGGNILTALAHPLLLADFLIRTAGASLGSDMTPFFSRPFIELYLATIAAGYLTTAIIGLMGLARRRLLHEAWVLLLTPVYWVCLSLAAWRALYQLLREPYRWEKTEHGLAKTSRVQSAAATPAAPRPFRDNA